MPTYVYKCKVCDDRFEIEQSFTDDSLTTLDGCPLSDDGAHQLKKVFSAVGISFKGEGFYRNDARSGAASKKKGSDGSDASESSSDTSSSTNGSSSKDSSSKDSSSKDSSSKDGSSKDGPSSSSSSSDSSPSKAASSTSSSD